ncbi:MAG: endo alpha-1,4 polygalactosaminidase [Chloroflexi bacterium]|nr:endo alpha-1,4 polygalactosaminidase [Chloroflexota bacterium]
MSGQARWLPLLTLIILPAVQSCRADAVGVPPSPSVVPPASSPIASQSAATAYWIPSPGTTWQWQLTELPVDLTVEADAIDLDLFDTNPETITALHAAGKKVICYISAGSWEDWRPDAATFPRDVIGKDYEGWPGERWLDIRQIDLLASIMSARLSLCREKGFDAVEPDNIDGYTNDTGFAITYEEQLRYNRWLAGEAHALGLSIGLKNDPEQAAELVADFDWSLTEDCFDQGWCDSLAPFLEAGKAVLAAEYTDTGVDFEEACAELEPAGFSLILKDRALSAWQETCR